jgi:terminase large subunit-like protein
MATLAGAMLIGISTPYRKTGLLYKKFRDHYGQDGSILVVRAPSLTLNPTLDQAIIDQAFAEDPAEAAAEWLAEFRADVNAFVARDVIESSVEPGRHELPPASGTVYFAYIDPAGGSGADSMALAIAHRDKDGYGILDVARERRPPFSPDDVVAEFAELMKAYRIHKVVVGDHWGGEFVRQPFRSHGIAYEVSAKTTSDTYRDTLPLFNSGKLRLYELPRLLTQLCNLERITARSGKDTISHPKRQHDDLANCTCGALLLASSRKPLVISDAVLQRAAMPTPYSRTHPRTHLMGARVGGRSVF